MDEYKKRPEPKKIKLPPLVDRSNQYDTLSLDCDTLYVNSDHIGKQINEDNSENNSQSIPELESM